jgi:hypothetical protein
MQRAIAAILSAVLLCSACATAGGAGLRPSHVADPRPDAALLTSYLKQLPVGSHVRVDVTGGRRLKGTLMKADNTGIVVQARTRIPEPPVQIALDRIVAVDLETSSSSAKAIGAGIAAGAGGALATFLVVLAIFAGD